jgi:hypothetical protein
LYRKTPINRQIFCRRTAAYVEITDQTNARTYPRQRFAVVPLAARVPVDGSTVTFDDNGRLTATLPTAGATTPGVIKATNAFVEVDAAGDITAIKQAQSLSEWMGLSAP